MRFFKYLSPRVLIPMAAAVFLVIALSTNHPLEAQASFDAGRVTVATTATAIYVTPPRGGRVRICNRSGAASIYIGNAAVTTATGYEILNATCEDVRAMPKATIYGIVAAATARVDYQAGYYKEP